MKKKIFLMAIMLCACITSIMAQDNATEDKTGKGISFVEGKTFDEALALAKESGKLLFVDCYTSWCGPCRMMSTQVFTREDVGDYFNKKFVSLKVDMEKGEGPQLKDKFGVKAFPTFLFISADGSEKSRIVGGNPDAAAFLKSVDAATGSESLSDMTKRYEGGERDTAFLLRYLKVLDVAYESRRCNDVAQVLLNGKEKDMLQNENLYKAFLRYNTTSLSSAFQYVLNNKDAFYAKYDKTELDNTISRVWKFYPLSFVQKDSTGKYTFDENALKDYEKVMEKWKVSNKDEIMLNTYIDAAQCLGQWDKFATLCTKYIKDYGENDMLIYNWALRIKANSKDPKVRKTAVGWMENRIKHLKQEKKQTEKTEKGSTKMMSMTDFSPYYEKLIDELSK